MPHEAIKQKIPQLHFKPEGYLSSGDAEFLDELKTFLEANGFDPGDLIYSGFDATEVAKGEPVPRHPFIFAMNEAAWRNAVKYRETNPAGYAEGWETPCIGLYDRNQLAQAYAYGIKLENIDDRVELSRIELGANLEDLPPDPIEEAVVHKDYPDRSPTDALVGLVYLE